MCMTKLFIFFIFITIHLNTFSQEEVCENGESPIKISMPWGDKKKCADGSEPKVKKDIKVADKIHKSKKFLSNDLFGQDKFENFITFFTMLIFKIEGSEKLGQELGIDTSDCSIIYNHKGKAYTIAEVLEKKFDKFSIRYKKNNKSCPIKMRAYDIGFSHFFNELIRYQNHRFFCEISLSNNSTFRKITPYNSLKKNRSDGCLMIEMESNKENVSRYLFEYKKLEIHVSGEKRVYSGSFIFEYDSLVKKVDLKKSSFNHTVD